MDIPRVRITSYRRQLRAGVIVVGLLVAMVALASLKPAVPALDRDALWIDSVRRGEMVRDVRGAGTLVPEHVRFVTSLAAGRVERVLTQPGEHVTAATALLELSNPDVQIQALQSEQQFTAARAELVNQQATLENQRLTQTGVLATTRTAFLRAQRQVVAADSLGRLGGLSRNDVQQARDEAEELATRYRIEQDRLALMTATLDSQIAVQRSQVERLRAVAEFQRNVVRSLQVRAGDSGVVSDLTLQLGQYVLAGTLLAKVVQPGTLKAVLQVPAVQARDVAVGQRASIDTRNGIVAGRVTRIDPNAINGTVAVDVHLERNAAGLRPDMGIEGTIELERLPGVLYTGRLAFGQANTTVDVFKLTDDGTHATRVRVRLGKGAANAIEIVEGLAAGDSIILTDMSRWAVDLVRIKR
ncbi:MAG TPA: HlyD family efflux transporter periplasmic adaptor subunit [Gemmatimonadales bacterium]|nr:HlyD family efflux transporter periplasmic adaptor subunit [Gemmatimonadales bacterium]